MLPKILITGVPGVGKTAISNNNLLIDEGFKYFQIGEQMRDIGKESGFFNKDFDLNNLTIDKRRELQNLVVEEMNKQQRGKGLIVDGHLVVDTNFGFIPGIELDMFTKCGFNTIVVIESKVEDIIEQRKKNIKKYANNSSEKEHLRIHQDLIHSSAMFYSMQCYINLHFVENKHNEIESAVKSILRIMQNTINRNGYSSST